MSPRTSANAGVPLEVLQEAGMLQLAAVGRLLIDIPGLSLGSRTYHQAVRVRGVAGHLQGCGLPPCLLSCLHEDASLRASLGALS